MVTGVMVILGSHIDDSIPPMLLSVGLLLEVVFEGTVPRKR
jgi:hypothetical protein